MKKLKFLTSLVLFVTIITVSLGTVGVHAEKQFEIRDAEAYVYSPENVITLQCGFLDTLPDVPYLNPADYLNVIFKDHFEESKINDGLYTLENDHYSVMFIDADNDTILFENYDDFIDCEVDEDNISLVIDFSIYSETRYAAKPNSVIIDLKPYDIDIIEFEDRVYLPLTVLGAMFSSVYNNAVYYDGKVCFVHTMDDNSYYYDLDLGYYFENLIRTREKADFTYNTLCLFFDYFFGLPSNTFITESIIEKGLDRTLKEYSETTALARQLLLSENMAEFLCGICIFQYFCYDGGHTYLLDTPFMGWGSFPDSPVIKAWQEIIYNDNDISNVFWDALNPLYDEFDFYGEIYNVRKAEYEKYEEDIVKEWDGGSYLIIHGDAAVYVFDSFQDYTPREFSEALQIAKENGVDVFILDDSNNGGGLVEACDFINSLITNKKNHSAESKTAYLNPLTGGIKQYVRILDLNLDGEYNEEDEEFYYDFKYAVLTSHASFSCGNYLPVYAKVNGIAILGETSGGGSCCVTERYMADGQMYYTADLLKMYINEGVDLDLGAEPDYVLTVEDEDGNKDYSGLYDIDRLAELTREFYKTDEPEPVDYVITEGAGSEWSEDENKDLTFVSDGEYNKFEHVLVDDVELDPESYTISEGSTVITLKYEYLSDLSAGEHTLTVVFTDGKATTTFIINVADPPEVDPPLTGDIGSPVMFILIISLSFCGFTAALKINRKRID